MPKESFSPYVEMGNVAEDGDRQQAGMQQVYPDTPPSYPGSYAQPHAGMQVPQSSVTIVTTSDSRPPDYLTFSILTCLCCNMILGILAIVFSLMSSHEVSQGDTKLARSYGTVAKKISTAAVILGITAVVIAVVTILVVYFVVESEIEKVDEITWQ